MPIFLKAVFISRYIGWMGINHFACAEGDTNGIPEKQKPYREFSIQKLGNFYYVVPNHASDLPLLPIL